MRRSTDARYLLVLLGLAVCLWLPRLRGPLDMRYDAGVYYILGTSLAEGRGYRLLNEPGAIQAIQYPPLLPAVAALHQRESSLDQALDLIPHLVRSPIRFGNSMSGHQNFSDFPVGGSIGPRIRGTQGIRNPPPPKR